MKKLLFTALFILLFATLSFSQETPQTDPDAMQTMLALNYCHMSLVKILAYEDRVILDEEYHNIINNINLVTIQDRELLTILKSLMDTLTDFRLVEKDREYLQQEYDRRVSALMYTQVGDGVVKTSDQLKTLTLAKMVVNHTKKILTSHALRTGLKSLATGTLTGLIAGGPAGVVVSGGTALLNMLFTSSSSSGLVAKLGPFIALHALSKVGGMYRNYQDNIAVYRETLDRKMWELEKKTIQRINETRKEFLTVYWELMHKYHIPDSWRLTEQQLAWFVEVSHEEDAERRWRLLEAEKEKFTVFPPFWYTLAHTAFETARLRESLQFYERVSTERIPFFRQDHDFSSALMNKILLIQTVQEIQPSLLDEMSIQVNIPRDLALIAQNSPNDWRKNLFVALQYVRFKEHEKAKALIVRNLDTHHEISLNSRVLGEIYALSEDEERLTALIDSMYCDGTIRYQDTLHLVGKIRDGSLLHDTVNTVVSSPLSAIDFRLESPLVYGDDVFIVRVPNRWSPPESPDQLMISLLPLEKDTEVLPDTRVRFLQLTAQTLSALQEEGVPPKTLATLETFKNEEYEESKFLSTLTKKVGDLSEDTLRLIVQHAYKVTEFHFEGILDRSDILDQRVRRPIVLALSDSSQVAALLLEVTVEEVEVGKNILDKSLEKSGEVLESASKLYDKLFSGEEEQASESGPTAKFEPRIVFSRKALKTSNACYTVNGSELEIQAECSF